MRSGCKMRCLVIHSNSPEYCDNRITYVEMKARPNVDIHVCFYKCIRCLLQLQLWNVYFWKVQTGNMASLQNTVASYYAEINCFYSVIGHRHHTNSKRKTDAMFFCRTLWRHIKPQGYDRIIAFASLKTVKLPLRIQLLMCSLNPPALCDKRELLGGMS